MQPIKTFYSQKTPSKDKNTFQSRPKGTPYTQYPVPVFQFNPDTEIGHSPKYRNSQNDQNVPIFDNTDFLNKPLTSQTKCRTQPGLKNLKKKINVSRYQDQNIYSEAEAIRRYGMQYRRKLMERYTQEGNAKSINLKLIETPKINHEGEIKNWYEDRNRGFQQMLLEYLAKVKNQFGANQFSIEQKQAIFGQMNMNWEKEAASRLKKCFQL